MSIGRRVSTLGEVIAQLRAALQLIGDGRRYLAHSAALIEESTQLLAQAWQGSYDPEAEHAIAGLFHAQRAVAEGCGVLEQSANTVRSYLHHLGADTPSGTPTATSATSSAPRQPARVRTGTGDGCTDGIVGTWRGKSAAEHAHDEGRAIGRRPARPKRYPVREVRSLQELDDLFAALSPGGEKIDKPTYAGHMLLFPDGTTIGYRVKSKTTVEPTIDIRTPDGWSLKIHVNTQGWD